MKRVTQKHEEFWIIAVAVLVAFTLAANHSTQLGVFGVIGNYFYWTFRILIQAAFFIAALYALEKYLSHRLSEWACYLLAVFLSLLPFVLAVTALDIIVGLPELGMDDGSGESMSRGWAFVLELFYLLDNHLVLGLLLLVPRLRLRAGEQTTQTDVDNVVGQTFFDSISPPFEGRICSMEAQEHYIQITTTAESRMVLHRFSDAVKQTPDSYGMQVHRSHWVAHSAVQEVIIEGQSMKLKLAGDKMIPVSRTFRAAVEGKYSESKQMLQGKL